MSKIFGSNYQKSVVCRNKKVTAYQTKLSNKNQEHTYLEAPNGRHKLLNMSTLGHVFSPVVVVVIVVVFVVVVLIVKFHAGCSWYNSTWQMPQRAIMGEQWIGSNYIRLHVLNICKTKCMPCFNEHPEQKFQASSLFGGKKHACTFRQAIALFSGIGIAHSAPSM